MALFKEKMFKGVVANYWKIVYSKYNAISKMTTATMALYFSKETRDADIANRLEEREFQFAGELTVEQCYGKITESILGKKIITPALYELDEDGVVKMPLVEVAPAVTEDYETNEFFNAQAV